MKRLLSGMIGLCGGCLSLLAQVPDQPAPAPAAPAPSRSTPSAPSPVFSPSPISPAGGGSGQSGNSMYGRDLPFFNPGSEIISWDGKHWNVNNQRIFQARFEKYLNAPEETTEDDLRYQGTIRSIIQKLAPENFSGDNLIQAWGLLPQASTFDVDAHLSDALADAVYSVWVVRREQGRLDQANEELKRQFTMENARAAATAGTSTTLRRNAKDTNGIKQDESTAGFKMAPYAMRIAETSARLAANKAKQEVLSVQVKVEFQALIVQLFLQRRYQHVIIGTRFYRRLFDDGDTGLKVGKESQDLFSKNTGMPPTVGTLDSIAHEAIRDTREGVETYKFLLQRNELESATKRLGEAFLIGEYMPEIRTLPREQKRQALAFAQKSNRLISALDVKDYTQAEALVKEIQPIARDFDTSQPLAAIETARTVSAMHLAKAKNAAVSGDRQTLEEELKQATAIWPRNPALAEVSGLIFSQADVQQKALVDLDQLLSQRNYRQIYDDKVRFIAATALYPDRQDKLKKVLEDMQMVEGTILRCNEIAKHGDYAGAWESAERIAQKFPEDNKLNQLRATLTTQAAEFVRSLKTAQQLEEKEQVGSSLAWYLKAQKLYPASEFAQEGIYRLVKKVVPNS